MSPLNIKENIEDSVINQKSLMLSFNYTNKESFNEKILLILSTFSKAKIEFFNYTKLPVSYLYNWDKINKTCQWKIYYIEFGHPLYL